MGHARTLKVAGLVVALLLSGLVVAKRSDPDEAHFVVLPNAIPAVDDPEFQPSGRSTDRVLGVEVGGEAKAYPISILNFHEVVNDELAGREIVVTYCPLCATGVVYERTMTGDTLTFRVSGRLYRNNLVMQDAQTGSLWSQAEGRAIRGEHEGKDLEMVPSTMTTLDVWRRQHPDTTVLAPPGGRDYDQDPYAGYDESDRVLYPSDGTPGPLEPKAMVFGVIRDGEAVAYPYRTLADRRVVEDVVGGDEIVVTYHAGAVQAFETGGRNFTHRSGFFMEDDTGARWNLVTGNGTNATLTRIEALPGFWFAWVNFHPDTRIYGESVGRAPTPGFQMNLLHPISLVVLGAMAWSMFALGRWCWVRWRRRGGYASEAWFDPKHGWINGILVGIVASASLYDAWLGVVPLYRWVQVALSVALLGWGVALAWEWRVHRGRVIKSTILDPEGVWWDLEEGLKEADIPVRVEESPGLHPARIRLDLIERRREIWVTPTGALSLPADDEELRSIVDGVLDRWSRPEGNK